MLGFIVFQGLKRIELEELAGHRHIKTTKRYETKKYDELQEQLKSVHPMEQLDFTV